MCERRARSSKLRLVGERTRDASGKRQRRPGRLGVAASDVARPGQEAAVAAHAGLCSFSTDEPKVVSVADGGLGASSQPTDAAW
jgi:hypothetical protein